MTPEQLKTSILQSAIQGKLVGQRAEEGTAEELYQQIQNEKAKLIKDKKIKKEKPSAPITEDEIPFEIPESWRWCRLGDITTVLGGKRIPAGRKLTKEDTGYKYIRVSDMKNGTVLTDDLQYVPKDIYPSISRYIINKEDIYITVAGTIGRVGKIPPEIDGANLTENADRLVFTDLKQDWLVYCLSSSLIQNQIADATTKVGQPKLAIKRIQELIIPLPPLAEQHRIVSKIEQLIPFVDRYAKAYEKLEHLNAKFPEDMKKSILQYAIQGKLVPQNLDDEPASVLLERIRAEKQELIKQGKIKKEKPLAPITENEIPFEIPESWKWVRLGQCGCFERGSGIKKDEVIPNGKPCVRYGQLYTTYKTRFSEAVSFVSQELFDKCHKVQQGDILMALTGENEYDIALAVTYEGKEVVAMGGDMTKFFNHCMNPLYLTYVLNSQYGILCKSKMASGNIIVHISNDKLASIPIPLPPLAEQYRIVAKIEELLPLCEKLRK